MMEYSSECYTTKTISTLVELLKNAEEEKVELRNKLKIADNRILDLEREHEQLNAYLPTDKRANASNTQNLFSMSANTSDADNGNHNRNVDSSEQLTISAPLLNAHNSDILMSSGDIEGTTPKVLLQTGSTYILHHPEPTAPLVVPDSCPRLSPKTPHIIDGKISKAKCDDNNRDPRSSKIASSPTPSWSEQRRRELDSFEDEQRMRVLLCRAISENASLLAREDYILDDVLDHLDTQGCITGEEYSKFIQPKNKCRNRMRAILGLILRRDCKTLLSFVDIINENSAHVADTITTTYDNISIRQDDMHIELHRCSHCLLLHRVDPVQLIDKLLSHDLKWLVFYEQVSRCEDMPEERLPLLDSFMSLVNDDGTSDEIIPLITETLAACGFHSDIVSSLKEDMRIGSNSFLCKNRNLGHRKSKAVGKCIGTDDSASEPQLMELILKYLPTQEENTSLKQPWHKSSASIITPDTPGEVNAGHCMQELKMCDFERETEQSGATLRNCLENYNSDKQTNDNHQSCNDVAILFVSNSTITITGRECIEAGPTSDDISCEKN